MSIKKRIVSLIVCILMLSSVAVPAFAERGNGGADPGYTVTRISNPGASEREADGLIEGGDRENSYAWRLAARGDEIYIATIRNITGALVNMYAAEFSAAGVDEEFFWSLIDLVTNGDILRNDSVEGANIISYNRVTGEFKVIYTADEGDSFRMAVTYGDDVYFGSYSAFPDHPQYILKLDPDGNFTRVFETKGSISMRANCVYDGSLFFAGADEREVVAEGDGDPTKMAVLRKSDDDDTVWDRVADYRDFGDIAYGSVMKSWAGAPVWELAAHGGYIYATAPSAEGFVIFRGRPANEGETANEYGWIWEEVAGLNNGVNNPGLSDVEGGEPGTMRSLIGSVYEWNGTLYAYGFDHAFAGVASAFAGILQQLTGKDVKASEYLYYLYNSLQNPQKIWALNDETGKFEEVKSFTELTEGTLNEYVWRMGEYDGDLYISTMDAGVGYDYVTQLTNGSFFKMSGEEIMQRVTYLAKLVKLLLAAKSSTGIDLSSVRESVISAIDLIKTLLTMKIDRKNLATFLDNCDAVKAELEESVKSTVERIKNSSLDKIVKYILTEDVTDKVLDGTLTISGILFNGVNVGALIPEELSNEYTQKLVTTLTLLSTMGMTYNMLDDFSKENIRGNLRALIAAYLADVLEQQKQKVNAFFDKIDLEGMRMYIYINDRVKDNEWGFDLFRTSDGKSFEVITRDGFGDKYNYGCSAFLETQDGLYIGTCNPFYGGQLYLLSNNEPEPEYEYAYEIPCTCDADCIGAGFVDMPARGSWAHDPFDWALALGVTCGESENLLGIDHACLRAQAATFIWRLAGSPEPTVTDCPFIDVPEDAYYRDAVLWMYENGFVFGTSENTFSPDLFCTRAEIITILDRLTGAKEPTITECPFTDVPEGAYYRRAVLRAFEDGVTAGTTETTFSPDRPCTRAEIITFLYKLFG